MTITVITGTPGAGKTLHAIEKLLLPLVGTMIPQTIDGVTTLHPRIIYTNIKGLLIDHELIDGGSEQGLGDWHLWAKPGSVICFDEVQKVWKPRPNGSKVPEEIEALETHRHMGVDFILITQNVMLMDRNIQALAARHLHVRRMANLALAIVYEWDHCSKSLMYSKALTKSPWRYDKKIFKLYHSADLHTKQPRSMPGLVWFILLGLVAAAVLGPTMYKRMQDRFTPPSLAAAPPHKTGQPGQALQNAGAAATPPVGPPAAPVAPALPAEVLAGCARFKTTCRCYDQQAQVIEKPADFCEAKTAPALISSTVDQFLERVQDARPVHSSSDLSLVAWVHRKDRPPPGTLHFN